MEDLNNEVHLDEWVLWVAEHVYPDGYFVFGIYYTEEEAWRPCIEHFIEGKEVRRGKIEVKGEIIDFGYMSQYKRYCVRQFTVGEKW